MSYTEKAIVWIDVETTGLNPYHDDHLLEVAVLITDLDLNLLDPTGYQATIYYPLAEAAALRDQADPFVQEMHDKTNLWARLSEAEAYDLRDAEYDTLAYIKRFVPEPRTARLGGNSVRLDLNFLDAYMPTVTQHLHYRMLDVSTVTGLSQWWANLDAFPKAKTHAAMDDIKESIAELRYLRNHISWIHTGSCDGGQAPEMYR